MYARTHAETAPDRPCIVMVDPDQTLTYSEFEARANRLAHLLWSNDLRPGDHYAIFMENHLSFLETCAAGERSGLYYTPISSRLTAGEVGYILRDCTAKVLITSSSLLPTAVEAIADASGVALTLVVDGGPGLDIRGVLDYERACAPFASTPLSMERLGAPMLYSSGTTGQPKGIHREIVDAPASRTTKSMAFLARDWGYREGMICLSPTPLYHGSPQSATGIAIRFGATVIVMRKFDAVLFLALIERYRVTHVQMVPTMFNRLLALPREVRHRYDVSSLEAVVHAAAPCSIATKEQMIEWWGPIIHEYYAATESIGYTSCTSAEWLEHPGTVGTAKLGEIHILDNDLNECPPGVPGKVFFRPPRPLSYWNDADKSKRASTADGSMSTVGDIGYLDEEGWLYLTDRESFMIISGGVNIYPQETENVLITHPAIADAAVFGIPNADLGEEVKAVVELRSGIVASEDLIEEILTYCRSRLARHKCPRSVDIATTLPRHDTGKLFKHELREPYWLGLESRI